MTYKDTCKIENRYEKKNFSLNHQVKSNYPGKVQLCSALEGYFLVSVDMIHDACYIILDIGNVDTLYQF